MEEEKMNQVGIVRVCASLVRLLLAIPLLSGYTAGAAEVDIQRADLSPVTVLPAPRHEPVKLVATGQALGQIFVAEPAPSAKLKVLVAELVEAVRLTTGAELPVVKDPPAADKPAIIIGDCPESPRPLRCTRCGWWNEPRGNGSMCNDRRLSGV
jgi:hypothetical protein